MHLKSLCCLLILSPIICIQLELLHVFTFYAVVEYFYNAMYYS